MEREESGLNSLAPTEEEPISLRKRTIFLALAAVAVTLVLVLAGLPRLENRQAGRAFLDRQAAALLPEHAAILDGLSTAPRYHITATVDPDRNLVQGEVVVRYTHTGQDSLPDLVFRLYPNAASIYGGGSLQVERVWQGDTNLALETSEGDTVLRVRLPSPLGPEESTEISMAFTAQVPAFPARGYGIFSRSDRVLSLAGWYPILAVYTDGWQATPIPAVGDALQAEISLYEVNLAAPDGYEVVSTGSVVTASIVTDPNLPQAEVVNWQIVSGPVREFAVALNQDFQKVETQVGGVNLRSFTLASEEPNTPAEASIELLAGAFQAYLERFGPYPYAELDLVETPITIGGYEFSGMVYIDDELRPQGEPASYEYLLAHEVAHQWWYGLVGSPTVSEPWLDEAHATYSAVLYLEDASRPEAAQALLANWQQELERSQTPVQPVGSSALEFTDWSEYRRSVYTRGALFLHELRQELGDDPFFELAHRFQKTYRFRQATSSDYLEMADEIAGTDLDPLVEKYFAGEAAISR